MSTQTAKPCGFPWLSPILTVRDGAAAIAFYEKAFGFSTKDAVRGEDGKIIHGEVTWKDGLIMLAPEGAFGHTTQSPATSGAAPSVYLYVYCDDVDALYAQATAAGAKGVAPPDNMFWGDRVCRVTDPDGYVWNFATHVGAPAATD